MDHPVDHDCDRRATGAALGGGLSAPPRNPHRSVALVVPASRDHRDDPSRMVCGGHRPRCAEATYPGSTGYGKPTMTGIDVASPRTRARITGVVYWCSF